MIEEGPHDREVNEERSSILVGFGVALVLLVTGIFLIVSPQYLGLPSALVVTLAVVATGCFAISFAGAAMEVAKTLKNEGLEYWGTGAVFVIPAAVALAVERSGAVSGAWQVVLQVTIVIMGWVGAIMWAYGLPLVLASLGESKSTEPVRARDIIGTSVALATAVVSGLSALGTLLALLGIAE